MLRWREAGLLLALSAVAGGCGEVGEPMAPARTTSPDADAAWTYLTCSAEVGASTLSCAPNDPATPDGVAAAVLGGQGVYVLLESSNVKYDEAAETFSADVTVRNLLTQALGTADGATVHPDGIRVFFHNAPAVTQGTGTVTVANADGEDTFISTNTEYFQYSQALASGKRSLPKTWQWHVPSTVESFTFVVGIAGATPDEATIEPGLPVEARTLGAGSNFSCALVLGGGAYCWGFGYAGQLGNGEGGMFGIPVSVAVPAGVEFVAISAGGGFACALSRTGDAYCWGYGNEGQMGNGTNSGAATPVQVTAPDDVKFVSISAGSGHNCAVATTGTAYCWGNGGDGRLGFGGSSDKTTPTAVQAPAGVSFVSISAGQYHTCALTTVGTVYCWGSGLNGELGNGTNGLSLTPVAVSMPAGEKFISVDAGWAHNCGVTASGKAYCWGYGGNGELGYGMTSSKSTPVQVTAPAGAKFVAVDAGNAYSCGITDSGAVYCWGNDNYGRLGNGLGGGTLVPDSVQAPAGLSFTVVSSGPTHACATAANGRVYCWGSGGSGEIGNGLFASANAPAVVSNVTNFAFLGPQPLTPGLERGLPATSTFEAYVLAARTGRNTGTPAVCSIGHA